MLKPPFLSTGSTTLTIQRRTSGTYVDGYWQEGNSEGYGSGYGEDYGPLELTTVEIKANVQPGLKWNDLQHLPEGERGRKSLRVYTDFELRTRQEGPDGHDADRFVWTDGNTYEVNVLCHSYSMGPLQHTKAICSRIETT